MKRVIAINVILMLAFAACTDSTGPVEGDPLFDDVPMGKSLVSMTIQGTAPTAISKSLADSVVLDVTDEAGISIGTLTLNTALVALKEIELKHKTEGESEDSLEIEIEFEGPFVVDLIHNTVSPSLDTVVIDTGIYNQIEMKIDKIEGDEDDEDGTPLVAASDPLFGNSIYIAGTYSGTTAGGDVEDMPFTMTFDLDEEFKLSTVDPTTGLADSALGFGVEPGVVNPIIIAFRLTTWLDFSDPETNDKGLDFSGLVVSQDSDGVDVIVLDEDSNGDNKDIRKVIKENIKESADYGEDKDGDGELGEDEDDDDDGN